MDKILLVMYRRLLSYAYENKHVLITVDVGPRVVTSQFTNYVYI